MARSANAIELLRSDHREVQKMFQRFTHASDREQEKICRDIVNALKLHTRIEEEVFYPYMREATGRLDWMEEANVEHTAAKQLIADIESHGDGLHRQAAVKVLCEYVGHHIREEEDKIFPLAEKSGVDLEALGQELMEHKQGRTGLAGGEGAAAPGQQAQSREAQEEEVALTARHSPPQ